MYERLLVPVDGSFFSERALPMAAALAARTGAELHLVTVVGPMGTLAALDWEVAKQERAADYLDALRADLVERFEGVVTTARLVGEPAEELLREALRVDADLIVIATHGRGALSRAWLGSVADVVSRRADRPVLLVRPDDGVEAEGGSNGDSVLVPLDGSELSEWALSYATELGRYLDATYHLTRVVPQPVTFASTYLPDTVLAITAALDEAREDAARYLEKHADRMRRRGMRVTTSVRVDNQPGRAILSEATAVGSTFIAMATHGYRGIKRAVLGSTADKVLRGADVPVLLCRPESDRDSKLAAS